MTQDDQDNCSFKPFIDQPAFTRCRNIFVLVFLFPLFSSLLEIIFSLTEITNQMFSSGKLLAKRREFCHSFFVLTSTWNVEIFCVNL